MSDQNQNNGQPQVKPLGTGIKAGTTMSLNSEFTSNGNQLQSNLKVSTASVLKSQNPNMAMSMDSLNQSSDSND